MGTPLDTHLDIIKNLQNNVEWLIEDYKLKEIDLAIAIEALKFYADKSNYNLVDEGRNYQSSYVCYELDKETYGDKELGTMARKTLENLGVKS